PPAATEHAETREFPALPAGVHPSAFSAEAIVKAEGAFPSGATMLLRLVAPDGTAYEAEADAAQGTSTLRANVSALVSEPPAPRIVRAANESEARAAAPAGPDGTGWTLEVGYAAGPAPPVAATMEIRLAATAWRLVVEPAPPSGR
ncbi:MAG TPA: hypothetical protein VHH36_06165, partial [Candidatus Thermoplasmatota archaeon]|nr:hypothetical protein [Candidatus Thermoplasmatota archaeon]